MHSIFKEVIHPLYEKEQFFDIAPYEHELKREYLEKVQKLRDKEQK